ncbi:ankyrin repeat domain-containing protein [Algiphilus sp.]|uniref:ankyrin repeat domain-containing protein n=1 Tax=Algiphilus sp. TaxID=1872431 RepID=UPI0032ED3CBA
MSVAVLAYAFPHRRTEVFLTEIALAGIKDVSVLAAPWRKLKTVDGERQLEKTINQVKPRDTKDICRALGYEYHEISHDDSDGIRQICFEAGCNYAIISGARILKGSLISVFPGGVINIHPGKIPETSGLDSFYYTIVKDAPLGATAHFIDERVDAGSQILFEETAVGPNDTPEVVHHNNSITEVAVLRRVLGMLIADEIVSVDVHRPKKNEPMSSDEKRRALTGFGPWRANRFHSQIKNSLFGACKNGDLVGVRAALAKVPDLIEARTPEGWTPLITACHFAKEEVVLELLQKGANPNACGANGTTPLMYAKSQVLGRRDSDYSIMEHLVEFGADIRRCDCYGRDINYYIDQDGDYRMKAWLRDKVGAQYNEW